MSSNAHQRKAKGKTKGLVTPIEPKSDNPSLNSEIHETTAINSSVKPEDYPQEDRKLQKAAATGRLRKPTG